MFRIAFNLLILTIFLTACNSVNENAEIIRKFNDRDTFYFEPIRDSDGNFDSAAHQLKRLRERQLNLVSLEKGFDSIQIRVWYGCALGEDLLVVLSVDNKRWKAEISKLTAHSYDDFATSGIDSVSKESFSGKPESGWNKFFRELLDLKILEIDDGNNVIKKEDVVSVNDGCDITIEIATKNVYRYYGYANPNFYTEKYWQARNITQIVELIQKEFRYSSDTPWGGDDPDKHNKKKSEIKKNDEAIEPDTLKISTVELPAISDTAGKQ